MVWAMILLIWTPVHNWLFDRAEHGLTGRSASDRPHGVRLLTVGHGPWSRGYLIDPDDLETLEELLAKTPQMDIELARARL